MPNQNQSVVPALSVKNLTKIYDKGKGEKIALNNISLTIQKGSFFGLLGPNGAGKSTLINCITGISSPTKGKILIEETDVVKDYKLARTKVGLSPQEFNVDIFSTPEELLDYMGGYYGFKKEIREKQINKLLKQFDLEEYRHIKFQKLSGGLKRRVILGRALIHSPNLLILDEPTAGVDVKQRRDLWQYLKDLNAQGKTIILTSHYLEEIQYLCDEIAIINHGKIIAQGKKIDFIKQGRSLEEIYLEITKEQKEK